MNTRPPLLLSTLLALSLIALSSAALWAAQKSQHAAQTQLTQARQRAQALHQRYQKTLADAPTLRDTIARFQTHQQQGLIGPENRLNWAKQLRSLAQEQRLGALEFTLTPQRSLGFVDAAREFERHASQMTLSLKLLHEGDLLRLHAALRAQPDAIVRPLNCTLATLADSSYRLSAHCTLDWISIDTHASPTPP